MSTREVDSSTAPVSLAITVRNEGESIRRLLDSICGLTVQPAEVVIVDGGSTDNTCEVIAAYTDRLPIRLVEQPGANISEGRNAAVKMAAHPVVAVTDAGVRFDPSWLEELLKPLEDSSVDVVSGFFVADPETPFEMAMGATVLPSLEDVDPDKFLPSSRSVAFRKVAWERAGGYPEWLDYCEDLVFDISLRDAGSRFAFAPRARVYFRPRSTLKAFFSQYYRYARGDGKADLWRKRHAIRYLTYTVGPGLAIWALSRRQTLPGKLALAAVAVATSLYCRRPYARLLPALGTLPLSARLYAISLVPVIRLTGDVAKMLGYPAGVVWRLRNHAGSIHSRASTLSPTPSPGQGKGLYE